MLTPPTAPDAPDPSAPKDTDNEDVTRNTAARTAALEDQDYVRRVRQWFRDAADAEKEARTEEDEDEAFASGHQWAKADIERMKAENRPALTLNFCLPIINAVAGEERINRQEIKIYGRNTEDDPGAFAMSELIRWVMDECNGDYSLSRGFRSAATSGRGWVGVTFSTIEDPAGRICVENIPRAEVYLDPLSVREDAADARFLLREKWLSEDDIGALWPDALPKIREFKATRLASNGSVNQTEDSPRGDAYRKGDKVYDPKKGTWQVLEAWHWEMKPGAVAINPQTGILEELTDQELKALLDQQQQATLAFQQAQQMGDMLIQQGYATGDVNLTNQGLATKQSAPPPPPPLEHVRRPIKCFYQGFVVGDVVLGRSEAPVRRLKRFPYVPIYGYRDEEKKRWFGLVRNIKDAQRQHNVEQSAILHWTQTTPKAGWMAPKGSFVDRARWETHSAKPGFIGEYNPSRGKPEQIAPPPLPRHMVEMAASRLQTMRDISGVNLDMMGMTAQQTPGVVMELRRKAGLTVLQTLFDNLRLSRRVLGEILIRYIQEFMADNRKIRVLGPSGANYVQATTDLAFADYDAVVEDAQDTPMDRMATMHIMQTTLPTLAKMGIPVPPSFIDVLPISQHIKDEWKQMLRGPAPPPAGPMGPAGAPNGGPPPAGSMPPPA